MGQIRATAAAVFDKRAVFCPTENAGLRLHFPAPFERMEDQGESEEEEGRGEEDAGLAEEPAERAGLSVEVQIGRKLREIGDRFQQDHVELVSLNPPRTEWTPPKSNKKELS